MAALFFLRLRDRDSDPGVTDPQTEREEKRRKRNITDSGRVFWEGLERDCSLGPLLFALNVR